MQPSHPSPQEHRKIIITGGNSGVGAQMAADFAHQGHQVYICGRRQDAVDRVAASHPSIHGICADVSVEKDIIDFFDAVEADGIPASVIIANAGIADSAPIDKTSAEMFDHLVAVNLRGVFLTMREGVRRLKQAEQQWGRIIAISSMTAKKGYPYISAYSASKHGVLGIVRSAAQELAKTQITVNAVCPGYLDTEMTAGSIASISEKTGLDAAQATDILAKFSPQRRLFTADEVSGLVSYLASDAAGGITGQAISLDGGETL